MAMTASPAPGMGWLIVNMMMARTAAITAPAIAAYVMVLLLVATGPTFLSV